MKKIFSLFTKYVCLKNIISNHEKRESIMNRINILIIILWIAGTGCGKHKEEPIQIIPASKPLRNADYYITVGESVNVRSQASVKSESIAKLNSGVFVIFLEDSKKQEVLSGKKSSWLKIEINDGKTGYVFGGFVLSKKEAFKKIVSKDSSLDNRKFMYNSKDSGSFFIFGEKNSISLEGNCIMQDPDTKVKKIEENNCSRKGKYQKIGNYVFISIEDKEFLMELSPMPDKQEEYALRQIEPATGSKDDIYHREIR
ncbi:MAG: SH3 domain-containing protein [Spirochaetes bacterium]|nr:SH3 domain-containing protein [Spirochaetota bacterium]